MVSSDELISKAVHVRMFRIGIDMKTLANQSGISVSALGGYLNNKVGWPVSALDKILGPLRWNSLNDITKAADVEQSIISELAA